MAELSQRHARLQEISGIMTAMKSLSLVEARKLERFIGEQQRMRDNIAAAAADFLQFHPAIGANAPRRAAATIVAIGSERGFCGAFNDRIVQALSDLTPMYGTASIVVVGHRLSSRLAVRPSVAARIDGPTVTEDVPAVLERLVDALHDLSAAGPAELKCLGHDRHGEPAVTTLLPLPRGAAGARRGIAPELHLDPQVFYGELLQQHLLAALLGHLYASLAAESNQRLAHMERALDRLDETLARLALKRNAMRQERIVEEIEVILSSEMAFDSRDQFRASNSDPGDRP
jgi:F-type H+-transporting ATPase subunit gamma